jgi:hypothetical protein
LKGGGAVVDTAQLRFTEGRRLEGRIDDGDYLGYHASFEVEGAQPLASESVRARVVISGIHESGVPIEVRGDGWFGYDDNGQPDGFFDHPPEILIVTDDDHDDEVGADDDRTPFIPNPAPRPPKQYLDAIRGRPANVD